MRRYPLTIEAIADFDHPYTQTVHYQSFGHHPVDAFRDVLRGDWARDVDLDAVQYAWMWVLPEPGNPTELFVEVKHKPRSTRGARPITYVHAFQTRRIDECPASREA